MGDDGCRRRARAPARRARGHRPPALAALRLDEPGPGPRRGRGPEVRSGDARACARAGRRGARRARSGRRDGSGRRGHHSHRLVRLHARARPPDAARRADRDATRPHAPIDRACDRGPLPGCARRGRARPRRALRRRGHAGRGESGRRVRAPGREPVIHALGRRRGTPLARACARSRRAGRGRRSASADRPARAARRRALRTGRA